MSFNELTYAPKTERGATVSGALVLPPSPDLLIRCIPLEEFPFQTQTPYAWIAPNGDFYPVRHCAHWDCAALLAPYFYPKAMADPNLDPMYMLERAGWLKLGYGWQEQAGVFMMWEERYDGPNDPQYETAKRIIERVRDTGDHHFAEVLTDSLNALILGTD